MKEDIDEFDPASVFGFDIESVHPYFGHADPDDLDARPEMENNLTLKLSE